MSKKTLKKEDIAKKAIEAVAFIFAAAAEKTNPFIVTNEELFFSIKVRLLRLEEDEILTYLEILFDADALMSDENLPNGSYRISYFHLVNLIILSVETSPKPQFFVLSGWENLIKQESIPQSLKEFFIAYQSLSIQRYFHCRLTPTANPSQEPVFNRNEN